MTAPLKFKPGAFVFECEGTRPLPPRWDPGIGREPARPWWWWLALAFYGSAVATALWVCYRTFAGWPLGHQWLMRLAG